MCSASGGTPVLKKLKTLLATHSVVILALNFVIPHVRWHHLLQRSPRHPHLFLLLSLLPPQSLPLASPSTSEMLQPLNAQILPPLQGMPDTGKALPDEPVSPGSSPRVPFCSGSIILSLLFFSLLDCKFSEVRTTFSLYLLGSNEEEKQEGDEMEIFYFPTATKNVFSLGRR